MLCTRPLAASGYIWMGDGALAHKSCYYRCEQRTIVPAGLACLKFYGEALMAVENNSWHLSKSVPVTFIFAIVCQTVAIVWYVSTLDASVETNAREIARHEVRIMEVERTAQTQAVMLGRIDENIKAIRENLERRND